RRAFDTAAALRDLGLDFVLAPISTAGRETVRRLTPRYSVALFPFVEGRAGQFGGYKPEERTAILAMLAELRQATAAVADASRRVELGIPGRQGLEAALAALEGPWDSGPYSELARVALARDVGVVTERLTRV